MEEMEEMERRMAAQTGTVLYTVGYGGRSPDGLAGLLEEKGVEVLVDVRAVPQTRIPGFNRVQLARFLEGRGVGYRHLGALGNLNRKAPAGSPVRLADEERGLSELAEAMEQHRVAIMCAEKDHRGCHRTYIADKMQTRVTGLQVEHII